MGLNKNDEANKVHTIKLQVSDNAYVHLMFLFKHFNTKDVQVVEDLPQDTQSATQTIDLSAYKIDAFKAIQDPLKWQQDIHSG